MNPYKRKKRIWHSFKHALDGISYVIRTQPNMQMHIGIGLLILILAIIFDIPVPDLIWVIFAVFFVMCMETLNTAIERTVDLMTTEYHPLAKLAKDISAGVVLFAAVFAIVTGVLVFAEPILDYFSVHLPSALDKWILVSIVGFIFLLCLITWLKRKG